MRRTVSMPRMRSARSPTAVVAEERRAKPHHAVPHRRPAGGGRRACRAGSGPPRGRPGSRRRRARRRPAAAACRTAASVRPSRDRRSPSIGAGRDREQQARERRRGRGDEQAGDVAANAEDGEAPDWPRREVLGKRRIDHVGARHAGTRRRPRRSWFRARVSGSIGRQRPTPPDDGASGRAGRASMARKAGPSSSHQSLVQRDLAKPEAAGIGEAPETIEQRRARDRRRAATRSVMPSAAATTDRAAASGSLPGRSPPPRPSADGRRRCRAGAASACDFRASSIDRALCRRRRIARLAVDQGRGDPAACTVDRPSPSVSSSRVRPEQRRRVERRDLAVGDQLGADLVGRRPAARVAADAAALRGRGVAQDRRVAARSHTTSCGGHRRVRSAACGVRRPPAAAPHRRCAAVPGRKAGRRTRHRSRRHRSARPPAPAPARRAPVLDQQERQRPARPGRRRRRLPADRPGSDAGPPRPSASTTTA